MQNVFLAPFTFNLRDDAGLPGVHTRARRTDNNALVERKLAK